MGRKLAPRDHRDIAFRFIGSLLALSAVSLACGPASPRANLPRRVAHGMGSVDGNAQTNSLEAFLANYAKGCRLFETDLSVTTDRKVVAFHGGNDSDRSGAPPSHAEFMKARILGRYTPLDAEGIARLMEDKSDWKLVTDTKTDLSESLEILCAALKERKLSCADRVVPQIYGPRDREAIEKLGFRQVIFTIYRTNFGETEIADMARSDPRIVAVTMPPARATPSLVAALRRSGIRCYVHTVNGPPAIRRIFDRGIWGVYTDGNCTEEP